MPIELGQKIVEGSPVIVLLLCIGLIVLWRRLGAKDQLVFALLRDTLTAVKDNTAAMNALREAILRGDSR